MKRDLPLTAPDDADGDLAELFNIHAALVSAEKARPVLRESARWQIMRADAYEAFWIAMQGAGR